MARHCRQCGETVRDCECWDCDCDPPAPGNDDPAGDPDGSEETGA